MLWSTFSTKTVAEKLCHIPTHSKDIYQIIKHVFEKKTGFNQLSSYDHALAESFLYECISPEANIIMKLPFCLCRNWEVTALHRETGRELPSPCW